MFKVTGSTPQIPGAKPGQRAIAIGGCRHGCRQRLAGHAGPAARQSACECERSSDIRLGSVMALLSGPTISSAINDPTNALAKLVETEKDDRKLINDVFLRVLNRPATESGDSNVLALLSPWMTDNIADHQRTRPARNENGARHRRHETKARSRPSPKPKPISPLTMK